MNRKVDGVLIARLLFTDSVIQLSQEERRGIKGSPHAIYVDSAVEEQHISGFIQTESADAGVVAAVIDGPAFFVFPCDGADIHQVEEPALIGKEQAEHLLSPTVARGFGRNRPEVS